MRIGIRNLTGTALAVVICKGDDGLYIVIAEAPFLTERYEARIIEVGDAHDVIFEEQDDS